MFRQAMRSPVITFHVVPSSMKAHYEQLSHPERNPSFSSGRFSPDSLAVDPHLHRTSRHGSQTHHPHPDRTDSYAHLSHPAAKPPTGQSPQRAANSTPTGFTKKVGRRFTILLKKGEERKMLI